MDSALHLTTDPNEIVTPLHNHRNEIASCLSERLKTCNRLKTPHTDRAQAIPCQVPSVIEKLLPEVFLVLQVVLKGDKSSFHQRNNPRVLTSEVRTNND